METARRPSPGKIELPARIRGVRVQHLIAVRFDSAVSRLGHLVSAFVGLAAGFCAIAGMVLGLGRGSLMTVPPVADPDWTGEWAAALVPASAAQELAFTGLLGVLTAALLLLAGAALVCGVLLMAEERIAATRSVAIQPALGVDRWRLAFEFVRHVEVRGRRAGAVALGVVLSLGVAIRWTWPDQVLGWSLLDRALTFGAVVAAQGGRNRHNGTSGARNLEAQAAIYFPFSAEFRATGSR